MPTIGQLISDIKSDLVRTDLDAVIRRKLNEAISYYASSQKFWFNQGRQTVTTSSGVQGYPLPEPFGNIYYVALLDDNGNQIREVYKTHFDSVLFLDVGTSQGEPTSYAIWENNLQLYPTPNQDNQQLEIYYWKHYLPLNNVNESNDFTDHAPQLIKNRAKMELAITPLRNMQMFQMHQAQEKDLLTALTMATKDKMTTGQLTDYSTSPYGFYSWRDSQNRGR